MIQEITPKEIRTRLDEIKAAQEAHKARDFDSELADAMRSGGDIDALEEAQLEAERQARRLRVERQALETALPDVIQSEVVVAIDSLVNDHQADLTAYKGLIDRLVEMDTEITEILEQMLAIGDRYTETSGKARKLTGLGSTPIVPTEIAEKLIAKIEAPGKEQKRLPGRIGHLVNNYFMVIAAERDRMETARINAEIARQRAAANQ